MAQTVPQIGEIFGVESDPTGTNVSVIGSQPTFNVVAGPVDKLEVITSPVTFDADSEAGPFTIQAQDSFGNPVTVSPARQVDLTSTSGQHLFSILGGNDFSPVTSVMIPNAQGTTSFFYRDTKPGTPTLTASPVGVEDQVDDEVAEQQRSRRRGSVQQSDAERRPEHERPDRTRQTNSDQTVAGCKETENCGQTSEGPVETVPQPGER